MAIVNLLDDPSYVFVDNSSSYSTNITPTGLRDSASNGSDHINFSLRRFDGADTTKPCLFAQYYNTNYREWIVANYQKLGGQTFIDNFASWSGITLPSGSNNQYLCLPFATANGGSLDLTQAYWTTLGNNTPPSYYVKPYASIIEVESGSGGGDTPSSDYSGIINAILMIPAVLLVLGAFTIIYRMFINRRVRG